MIRGRIQLRARGDAAARIVSVEDARRAARRRVPRAVFEFVDGGAEEGLAQRRNRDAFERTTLLPRALTDVARIDRSATVAGLELGAPLLLAPTGLSRLIHPDGELATARAAGERGIVFVVSTGSSFTIEQIAAAATGPLWFQLYPWGGRELIGQLIDRAARSGYEALVVTVDVPAAGKRDHDVRNGATLPPTLTARGALDACLRPAWLAGFLRSPPVGFDNLVPPGADEAAALEAYTNMLIDPATSWEELAWIRERWRGPLLLKGVLSRDDARIAADLGVDGVVVSNHGGRQLDAAPATLDVLPGIVAEVGDRIDVLVDGGVRRGVDLVKAAALGAAACMIGRPYVYGLAAAGERGVGRVIDILLEELDVALKLVGRGELRTIDRSVLWRTAAEGEAPVHDTTESLDGGAHA